MTSIPLAKLVEDFAIYPRHAVDDANVANLANALKAGVTLPPIIADQNSLRIVDGWHRRRAYRRVLGPEAAVDVELRKYASEEEILLDAILRNASHGRKLDMIDQVRATALCQERGISLSRIATVLHVPEERVRKLSVRLASTPSPGTGAIPGTLSVALKRPVQHLAGSTLTAEQVEAHNRAPGVSYLLITNQLREAMDAGFINRGDTRLVQAMAALRDTLTAFLAT